MLTEPVPLGASDDGRAGHALEAAPAQTQAGAAIDSDLAARFTRITEWMLLMIVLGVVGAMIGWSLFKAHDALDATERDRLRGQARVVDDNVGQQLDGVNRALASVRDEYLTTPLYSVSTLISMRLKALSGAIPGVRSMVLVDADGTVAASSVDMLIGRDFADRDYFRAARDGKSSDTLYVAAPFTPRSAATPSSSREPSTRPTVLSSAPSRRRSSRSTFRSCCARCSTRPTCGSRSRTATARSS